MASLLGRNPTRVVAYNELAQESLASRNALCPLFASIVKEPKAEKTIAVLGYNASIGLDDRLLEDTIKSSTIDVKLEIVDGTKHTFPIEGRVDAYERDLLAKLAKGPYKIIDKKK